MTFIKQFQRFFVSPRAMSIAVLASLFVITACSGRGSEPLTNPRHDDLKRTKQQSGLLSGDSGSIDLFGGFGKSDSTGTTGIGVNSYLWRASLDTISFMPLASVDPFGGVIITEWYSPPETPNERLKVNITILDTSLRADAIRTSVFRQAFDEESRVWRDAQTSPETERKLENAILVRARELRVAQKAAEDN